MLAVGCSDDGATGDDAAGTGTSEGTTTDISTTGTGTDTNGTTTTSTSTTSTTTDDSTTGTGSTGDGGSTGDVGTGSTGGSTGEGSTGEALGPDPTGDLLLGAALSISPDLPLQWTVEATFTPSASPAAGGTLSLTLQSLALNPSSTDTPRTPVGAASTYPNVAVDAQGNFSLALGEVELDGAANPITGSDLTVNMTMTGQVLPDETLCGDLSGMIVVPVSANLAGSTFGTVGITDTSPQTLPDVVASCAGS